MHVFNPFTAGPALLIAAGAAAPLSAATIPGLFNTGTDGSNVALAGGNGVIDTHYTIVSSTSPGLVGQQAVTFNCCYSPDDADSRWVSLSANGNPGSNTTTYRLTFNMSGLNASTASITGNWGADNVGNIFFNGVSTGITTTNSFFGPMPVFSITSGFVTGVNTLDFEIQDLGQPTAFRVDNLVGTARPLVGVVPEPSTWTLLILGFGVIGAAARRTRAFHSGLAAA